MQQQNAKPASRIDVDAWVLPRHRPVAPRRPFFASSFVRVRTTTTTSWSLRSPSSRRFSFVAMSSPRIRQPYSSSIPYLRRRPLPERHRRFLPSGRLEYPRHRRGVVIPRYDGRGIVDQRRVRIASRRDRANDIDIDGKKRWRRRQRRRHCDVHLRATGAGCWTSAGSRILRTPRGTCSSDAGGARDVVVVVVVVVDLAGGMPMTTTGTSVVAFVRRPPPEIGGTSSISHTTKNEYEYEYDDHADGRGIDVVRFE